MWSHGSPLAPDMVDSMSVPTTHGACVLTHADAPQASKAAVPQGFSVIWLAVNVKGTDSRTSHQATIGESKLWATSSTPRCPIALPVQRSRSPGREK
jgi:hypothetical protein